MNCNMHTHTHRLSHPGRHILPWAKRIRNRTPVSPQIFIITLWKDSRRRERVRARTSERKKAEKKRMRV